MNNLEQLANDPPLRAVRTFEAFARHGGVNSAARELDVSPSAVSHQLHLLESFLQQPLTLRQGRNLVYRAAFEQMNALLGYLTENCCQGEACLAVGAASCNC